MSAIHKLYASADEGEEVKKEGGLIDFIYLVSIGAACGIGLFQGFTLDWLTGEIEEDTTRYPVTAATTNGWTQAWAVDTKEPRAWKSTGRMMMFSYIVAGALWTANFVLGNNASVVHRVFYRLSQGFMLIPLMNLTLIYRIKSQYLINNWYTYYDSLGTANGGTVKQDEYMWLYSPTETDETAVSFYDVQNHNSKLWRAAWL